MPRETEVTFLWERKGIADTGKATLVLLTFKEKTI